MILIVMDRRSDLTPEIPNAITIKVCSHPSQLNGVAKYQTYYANTATASQGLNKAIQKAIQQQAGMPASIGFIYYAELDVEGEKLSCRLSIVNTDGTVQPQLLEIRRGKFFAGQSETAIDIQGVRLGNRETLEMFREVIEIAEFICYEIQ